MKTPTFTNAPCKTACLYNAPSMHTVDLQCAFGVSGFRDSVGAPGDCNSWAFILIFSLFLCFFLPSFFVFFFSLSLSLSFSLFFFCSLALPLSNPEFWIRCRLARRARAELLPRSSRECSLQVLSRVLSEIGGLPTMLHNGNPLESLLPKGPFRTKNTTESELRYGEQIRYGRSKTLRRGLRSACFSRKRGRKTVRILKNYGGGKIVRIRAPYYF